MSDTISRVEKEFIFNFLIKNKVKFEIKCGVSNIEANILEQNVKELKIDLLTMSEEIKEYQAPISVFFYFQNTHHTFNSVILRLQGSYAIIRNPESIIRNLLRKFERIRLTETIPVEFEIEKDILPLNYPVSDISYFPDKPPVSADFTDIKIDIILTKFKEKLSSIISNNKILMLRNYTAKNIFEELVLKYGKILYIPNTHADIPNRQIDSSLEIITRDEWVKYEVDKNKTQENSLNKVLSQYLLDLSKNNIFSLSIIPILYRNYTVGIIYLINNHQKSQIIDLKIIKYASQFSRVSSYTLKQSGYFKDEEGGKEKISAPIYDLSPGGLAFSYNESKNSDKLLLDHNFKILFKIENRPIRVLAKLVRKFNYLSQQFYGFVFIDIRKEDHEFIYRYLYKK